MPYNRSNDRHFALIATPYQRIHIYYTRLTSSNRCWFFFYLRAGTKVLNILYDILVLI